MHGLHILTYSKQSAPDREETQHCHLPLLMKDDLRIPIWIKAYFEDFIGESPSCPLCAPETIQQNPKCISQGSMQCQNTNMVISANNTIEHDCSWAQWSSLNHGCKNKKKK